MASTTRIPKAELTGVYGAIVKRMSRRMFGEVAEPVEVAWHNRKVVDFGFTIGRKSQKWDRCDADLKSFAHMAVPAYVLLNALGAPRLIELTTCVALANLYTRSNTALGIESQGLSASCDLKPLATASAA